MHGVLPGCPRCWINLKNIPQRNSLDSSLSPVMLRKSAKLARDATALTIALNPQTNCMVNTNASASFSQDCAANETDSEKTKQPGTFLWHVPRSSQHTSALFWPSHIFFFLIEKAKNCSFVTSRVMYFFFFSFCAVSQPLDYCELSNRFPRDQWNSALQFFLKKQEDWWSCTLSAQSG